jgi:hypothetical protein
LHSSLGRCELASQQRADAAISLSLPDHSLPNHCLTPPPPSLPAPSHSPSLLCTRDQQAHAQNLLSQRDLDYRDQQLAKLQQALARSKHELKVSNSQHRPCFCRQARVCSFQCSSRASIMSSRCSVHACAYNASITACTHCSCICVLCAYMHSFVRLVHVYAIACAVHACRCTRRAGIINVDAMHE